MDFELPDYYRGDTAPIPFTLTQADGVTAQDITGFTFTFTMNTERNPTNTDNEVVSIAGTITSASDGEFEFRPSNSPLDMDLTPALYYCDVQYLDAASKRHTRKGTIRIVQDVTK